MGEKKPYLRTYRGPKRAKDQNVVIAQRRAQVWALRVTGASYRRIATELGLVVSMVHRDLTAERTELTQEALEEIASHKATLIAREEAIIETHWPLREAPESAKVIQASDKMIAQLSGALIVRNELTGKDGGPLAVGPMTTYTDAQLSRLALGQSAGHSGEGDAGASPSGAPED